MRRPIKKNKISHFLLLHLSLQENLKSAEIRRKWSKCITPFWGWNYFLLHSVHFITFIFFIKRDFGHLFMHSEKLDSIQEIKQRFATSLFWFVITINLIEQQNYCFVINIFKEFLSLNLGEWHTLQIHSEFTLLGIALLSLRANFCLLGICSLGRERGTPHNFLLADTVIKSTLWWCVFSDYFLGGNQK